MAAGKLILGKIDAVVFQAGLFYQFIDFPDGQTRLAGYHIQGKINVSLRCGKRPVLQYPRSGNQCA